MEISPKLEIELKKEIFKASYYEFFKWAFKILLPADNLEDTFHIQYLCDELQKEVERIVRREEKGEDMIINIPPRASKSLITSVCLLPWVWLHLPHATFICVSFDSKLSNKNSQDCRDIIRSDAYQELFGDIYQMRGDSDGKEYFQNNKMGHRISCTTGSNITGQKGMFILCLSENQLVTTNKGPLTIKEIVDNQLDVEVLTHNLLTDQNEYKRILKYEKNPGKRLLKIKTKTRELVCTEEHPIWTENRGWIQAKDIQNNDELVIEDE